MGDSDGPARLYLHGEKTLAVPVRARLFACCPTMDLIAVVCQPTQLDVYRLNGQRAFDYQSPSADGEIVSVCWKYNGQSIAIGWDNGNVDVISAETGKVSQHITVSRAKRMSTGDLAPKSVACLGWGLNLLDVDVVKAKTHSSRNKKLPRHETFAGQDPFSSDADLSVLLGTEEDDPVSIDDFLARLPDTKLLDLNPNLPDQLALLDPESQLPKLSILPILSGHAGAKATDNPLAEAFASQASLDAVLQPHRVGDINGIDVLLKMDSNGKTVPVLYGSLALRSLRQPSGFASTEPKLHAYSPLASTHFILARSRLSHSAEDDYKMALLPLSLSFTRSSEKHLQAISSKAARIQVLVHYIRGCIDSLAYHWKQSQDLPTKFMRVVSETLAENQETGLVASLFHLAATGHCPPTIKEWLTEQLTERGHKRWDHAVNLGYSKILEITHENLLPAIDRCTILLSSLRGVATYYQDTGVFDVPPRKMTVALEMLQNLRVLSYHLLHFAGVERKQFSAFSAWLRYEIDTLGADASAAEDAVEQDPGLGYTKVLAYIKDPLSTSKVRAFVSDILDGLPEIPAQDMTPQTIAKHVDAMRGGRESNQFALSLRAHYSLFKASCEDLSELIVQWQLANSAYHMGILIEDEVETHDMRMVFEDIPKLPHHITTYLALTPLKNRNQIHIYRLVHAETLLDQKCITSTECTIINLGDRRVHEVRFADDLSLVALVESGGISFLVRAPYRAHTADAAQQLEYSPLRCTTVNTADRHAELLQLWRPDDSGQSIHTDLSRWEDLEFRVIHTFLEKDRFRPAYLAINGRKDRRLVYVLGDDAKQYKIFDLDHSQSEAAEDTNLSEKSSNDTLMRDRST